MNGFLTDFWRDFATVLGLVLTVGGFVWAITVASRAKSASEEARSRITRQLQLADLHSAIGLIDSIKILHDVDRWEASTALYPWLRAMLTDLIGRYPRDQEEIRSSLATARASVYSMEESVRGLEPASTPDGQREELYRELNAIQTTLHELASDRIADSRGE